MLEVGTKAPDFDLNDKDGKAFKLSDFLGKKVVVYFYPKDNTPGCTRQACAFRDNYSEFENRKITVIGISKDSESSHKNFASKYNLPFILLSDPTLETMKAYGAWGEKKLYGKSVLGVTRCTFVVDEKGTIIKVFKKANPDTNAEDILKALN
ncbi:MAG: thioredoxin-dependent thiol peroxidase [Spirochaetales bacterium]